MRTRIVVAVALAGALALGACSKSEEPAPKAEAPAQKVEPSASHEAQPGGTGSMGAAPVKRQVVVPDDVKAAWKAVVLTVTDKKENKSEDVTIGIGQTATVGGLEITVETFLPAFTMGGGVITSKSNDTENPAARLVIKENGQEVFSGWLFSMYPEAHAFEHERYAILLKDFVKAE
ncbi:DUF2155 domain-containing protein [Deferrisoma camini]|uniref:DUF2155 domain-containing protein n=1 Tax=Deferrisoma camini TaxID=1035120 RepID=UPI0004A28A01|nr:DUF2155 domain-containing protein [Deferrisoma camini]